MSLYDQWQNLVSIPQTAEQQHAFWDDYLETETEVYRKILKDTSVVYEGTLKEVGEELGIEPVIMAGFIDGTNTSLQEEMDVEALEEDTPVKLAYDLEKLYYNMHEARAKWLYNLEEWEDVLSEEKREDISRKWREEQQAVATVTVGRNEPCPCGSGKKYKRCCWQKDRNKEV